MNGKSSGDEAASGTLWRGTGDCHDTAGRRLLHGRALPGATSGVEAR